MKSKARYVDGFVLSVPKKRLAAYKKMAVTAGKIWIEHGALEYREAAGEDMKNAFGVPFPKLAKARPGEAVIFSWITYRNRAHRDKVNAKVMKDPRIAASCEGPMPFDCKRMAYGGFEIIVSGG